jgi:protein-disulfide reductase (glutathione)
MLPRFFISLFALVIAVSSSATLSTDTALSHGWGDNLAWMSMKEGLIEASATKKPIMLIIWKTWCGACKALRPLFAASPEIASESSSFIMVNTVDDEEPTGSSFSPDGGYIPRILFLTPEGEVITEGYAQNHGAVEKYKYFHSGPDSVVATMIAVKARNAAEVLASSEVPASLSGQDL